MPHTGLDNQPTVHILLRFDVEKLASISSSTICPTKQFPIDFFNMFDLAKNQEDERVKKFDFDFATYTINAEIMISSWVDFEHNFAEFVNNYSTVLIDVQAQVIPPTGSTVESDDALLYTVIKFSHNLYPVKSRAVFTDVFGWTVLDEWESIKID